jgi:hypothetical protein
MDHGTQILCAPFLVILLESGVIYVLVMIQLPVALALGKQRLRQVLTLKMKWVEEDDPEVRGGLMAEMQELKRGTMHLDVVVSYWHSFI